jgi:DNA-binding NarL/FixJ family response regulator
MTAREVTSLWGGFMRRALIRLLSAREVEVLRGLIEGRTEKEVAREMNLSPHTVHVHVKSIYKKLAVRRRAQLLREVFGRSVEVSLAADKPLAQEGVRL